MTMQRDEILEHALALSPEDREIVADALERSLLEESADQAEIDEAWRVEILRRVEAHDRGETQAISVDEMLANAQKALAEHRARKAQP